MKLIIFLAGMIFGGTIAIIFHCMVILAKESDKKIWIYLLKHKN